MAAQIRTGKDIKQFRLPTPQSLAIGKCVEIKVDGLRCVGKRLLEDPDYVDRFKQECQILSELKHPNIVQLWGPMKVNRQG